MKTKIVVIKMLEMQHRDLLKIYPHKLTLIQAVQLKINDLNFKNVNCFLSKIYFYAKKKNINSLTHIFSKTNPDK